MGFFQSAKCLSLILAAALAVSATARRAHADEPTTLGDILRSAQEKRSPSELKAPDKQPASPAESSPPAATGEVATTSDEAPPPEKPTGVSDAEWGRKLRSQGDNRAAIAALSEGIQLNPLDAVSYRERGLAQLDIDVLDKAIADFDRALALNGDDDDARWGCGQAFLMLGNLASALDEAEYLIERSPNDARFRRLRGHVFLMQLLYDAALADYSEAVLLDPGDATSHRWRARALRALGRMTEAIREWDEILRLKPDDASAFYYRAFAHGAVGDWQATTNDLTECLRLEGKTPEVLLQRAAAYSLTGEAGLAERDYLTAAIEASEYKLAQWEPVLFQPTAAEAEFVAETEPDPANVVAEFAISPSSDGVIVPVRFAGRWMRFVVDTGASCTVLDRSHVDLLRPFGRNATVTTAGGLADVPMYEAITLSLGTGVATTTDGPVGCYDLSIASDVASGPIDGVLGLDVLTEFVLRLDLARHKVYFLRLCGGEEGVSIPFAPGSGMKPGPAEPGIFWEIPAVAMEVGADRKILADLDTGMVAGSVSIQGDSYDKLASEHQIVPHRLTLDGSIEGLQLSPTGILARVGLAGFEHQNIAVDRGQTGNALGLRYLARYVATFDFPNRRLLLQPSPLFPVSEAELSLRLGKTWAHSIATYTLETAQRHLDGLVADHPDSALVYQSRGLFACTRGNFDAAIKDFSTAIELERPTMESLYYRAAAYCNKEQWEECTADLSQAIQLEPNNPQLFQVRGQVWAARGNLKLAIADLREAVRLYPEPRVQERLDSLLAQQASAEAKPARQTGRVTPPVSQGRGRPLTRWQARRMARIGRWH